MSISSLLSQLVDIFRNWSHDTPEPYVLPAATADTLGGVKVGDGLSVTEDGVASVDKANPVFTGSISLGRKADTTVGYNSVAEGSSTTASGPMSHAEGTSNTASGAESHAEGAGNTVSGAQAHAEGTNNVASGYASHVEGSGNIASKQKQHVSGQYNIEDTDVEHAVIVGNGTGNNARSNAYQLDWNGKGEYASDVIANAFGSSPVSLAGLGNRVGNIVPVVFTASTNTDDADIECNYTPEEILELMKANADVIFILKQPIYGNDDFSGSTMIGTPVSYTTHPPEDTVWICIYFHYQFISSGRVHLNEIEIVGDSHEYTATHTSVQIEIDA